MSNELNNIFREKGEYIRIYLGKETLQDKFEKNVTIEHLNPIPIKAIVTDLIASQSVWKMPGIETKNAKEIIIKKKYETMLKASQKIQIGNDYYEGWRINGELQYRIEQNYIRAYIYIKKV